MEERGLLIGSRKTVPSSLSLGHHVIGEEADQRFSAECLSIAFEWAICEARIVPDRT